MINMGTGIVKGTVTTIIIGIGTGTVIMDIAIAIVITAAAMAAATAMAMTTNIVAAGTPLPEDRNRIPDRMDTTTITITPTEETPVVDAITTDQVYVL